jgi:hypothetical protein
VLLNQSKDFVNRTHMAFCFFLSIGNQRSIMQCHLLLMEKKYILYFVLEDHLCVICKVTPCFHKLCSMERKDKNSSFVFQGWSCVPAGRSRDQYQLMG